MMWRKNRPVFFAFFVVMGFFTLSCTHKNTKVETLKFADKLVHDRLDINGNYYWSFQLMGGEQLSYHTFHADSIEYTMEGKVYSTRYTMQKLSFDRTTNKWIGQDENNIVYVLFFKGVTDSTLVLYKHKCKSNGLKEALDFKLPEPDATEDHGWNIYYKNTDHSQDKLPVSGIFLSKEGISINISDGKVQVGEKSYDKLSYHSGERRWVGQFEKEYLQIFLKDLSAKDTMVLSIKTYTNLEKAYKTKYNKVNWVNYFKKNQKKS